MSDSPLALFRDITTFIFDVDGVMTDGSVTLLPSGEQVRKMIVRDGYALQLAVKKGYRVAIISGGRSEAVRLRLQGLGITDIYLAAQNKRDAYDELILTYDLKPGELLYMGDDLPDLEVMTQVALPTCPADAASEVKQISKYISDKNGGEGCVRDVIERTMRVQNNWYDHGKRQEQAEDFRW